MHFLNENGQSRTLNKSNNKKRRTKTKNGLTMYGNFCSITNPMMFASTHFDSWSDDAQGRSESFFLFPGLGLSHFDETPLCPTDGCLLERLRCPAIPSSRHGSTFLPIFPISQIFLVGPGGPFFVHRSALIRMFGLEYVNIFACLSIRTLSCCCISILDSLPLGSELEIQETRTESNCWIVFSGGRRKGLHSNWSRLQRTRKKLIKI